MTTVDSEPLFVALRSEMNDHPERFEPLGEAKMTCGVVMRREGGDASFLLDFSGIQCTRVATAVAEEVDRADFTLDGPVEEWRGMFADIVEHGRATGRWTLNSLALLADRIHLGGTDPMGLDRFSRFNQTLQEFFDGAARVAAPVA